MAELETRLDRLRDSLRVHLVALYSVGRQRLLRLVLAMQPSTDAPAAIRQLRFLARRDALAAEEYRVTIGRLAQERAALDVERVRSTTWLAQEEERRVALAAVRAEHQALAAEADRRRRQLESRAASLRQREARLDRMIEVLTSDDPSVLDSTDIRQFRGVLDWPIEGEVVTEFGPRLDPRYRTQVPHNGLAIAAIGRRPRGARHLSRQGALRRAVPGVRADGGGAARGGRSEPLCGPLGAPGGQR